MRSSTRECFWWVCAAVGCALFDPVRARALEPVPAAVPAVETETETETAPAHASAEPGAYSLHFQETTVTQTHPSFRATYSAAHSLSQRPETETSITSTLFAGVAAWRGAELYFNPELSGGSGLSSAYGVAGFPNGEAFRIGSPKPVIYAARAYLRQTFNFGGGTENVDDGLNQIAGQRDTHRLTVTAGKFGIADIFDNNAYTHDPRTQFLSWALMNSGAWDYPADTRGYTWGVSVEHALGWWTVRAAMVMVPREANGLAMDLQIGRAHGFALENEARFVINGRKGVVRGLLFLNQARMGSYDQSLSSPVYKTDVANTREYGRTKYGFTLGLQQALTRSLAGFVRLSGNDGRNETWAFAEIDQSAAIGLVHDGAPWRRAQDELSAAFVLDGISGPHQRYLAAGGYGFMLGDGMLSYALEAIAEVYYRFALTREIAFSPDYQLIVHPAYNADRGPVHVFGIRAHVQL